jgi:hypothetical protein
MICIDRDAWYCGKSRCDDHIEGTCTHQASEDETDAGGKLARWQISFKTPSDLWDFVALLKLLLINNFEILYQNYGAKAKSDDFFSHFTLCYVI